jgi:hypothetical protein
MKSLAHRVAFLCAAFCVAVAAHAQEPQLEQLVAPIALYPDALVAQMLAASTNPAQVAEAASWIRQNPGLKGTELAEAVNAQVWDPSVKALTQFPAVLNNMDQNASWTAALGQAYASQPAAVMDAVQVMRRRAQAAGHLGSTSQQMVTTEGNTIEIQPANPSVVYVPAYDPWVVYGGPIGAYPGWGPVLGLYYAGPGLYWGPAFEVGLFAGYGWGWNHWGFDWQHRALLHDRAPWRYRGPAVVYAAPRPGFHAAPHAEFEGRGEFHGSERGEFRGGARR